MRALGALCPGRPPPLRPQRCSWACHPGSCPLAGGGVAAAAASGAHSEVMRPWDRLGPPAWAGRCLRPRWRPRDAAAEASAEARTLGRSLLIGGKRAVKHAISYTFSPPPPFRILYHQTVLYSSSAPPPVERYGRQGRGCCRRARRAPARRPLHRSPRRSVDTAALVHLYPPLAAQRAPGPGGKVERGSGVTAARRH